MVRPPYSADLLQLGAERRARLEADDWRKVFAFAASAGDTISERDALEVIRDIARRRVHMAAAIAAAGERKAGAR